MRPKGLFAATTLSLLLPLLSACNQASRSGSAEQASSSPPVTARPVEPNGSEQKSKPKPRPTPPPTARPQQDRSPASDSQRRPLPAPTPARAQPPLVGEAVGALVGEAVGGPKRVPDHVPDRVPAIAEKILHGGPAATPPPPPPSDEQLLEAALSKLHKGNLAYSTPQTMKAGTTAHVVARIGSDTVSLDTLKANLPTDQNQKVETAATPVSTRMKMTLKGADFDITPLSSEEQLVAGDTPTQWEWDVVPKHSGELRLHLAAVVELNGLAKDFTSVDRNIAVQVDPIDAFTKFIGTNWQWLIATLTAVIGAAWKFFSSRRSKVPA